jgi:hypothetical protein
MPRSTKSWWLFAIAIVLLTIIASWRAYYVQESVSARAYSRGNENYVFLTVNKAGWRVSCVDYVLAIGRAFLRISDPQTDNWSTLIVFRISKAGVERFSVEGYRSGDYRAQGENIYIYQRDGLYRWNRTQWIRATIKEREQFEHAQYPYTGTWQDLDPFGLFQHRDTPARREFQLPNSVATLLTETKNTDKTIRLRVEGKEEQTLFTQNSEPHRVPREEYFRILHIGEEAKF